MIIRRCKDIGEQIFNSIEKTAEKCEKEQLNELKGLALFGFIYWKVCICS